MELNGVKTEWDRDLAQIARRLGKNAGDGGRDGGRAENAPKQLEQAITEFAEKEVRRLAAQIRQNTVPLFQDETLKTEGAAPENESAEEREVRRRRGDESRPARLSQELQKAIEEAKVLFEELARQALTGTPGKEQTAALEKAVLAAILSLLENRLATLAGLLSGYGERDSLALLIASLYGQVTGKSPQSLEGGIGRWLERGFFPEGNGGGAASHSGFLYGNDGRPREGPVQGKELGRRGGGPPDMDLTRRPFAGSAGATFELSRKAAKQQVGRLGDGLYTTWDMALGEAFAESLLDRGVPFSREQLREGGEVLRGISAALIQLKTQTFIQYGGVGKAMSLTLQSAAERFLFQTYLQRSQNNQTTGDWKETQGMDREWTSAKSRGRKGSELYHLIVKEAADTGDLEKAILKGVGLAMEWESKELLLGQEAASSGREHGRGAESALILPQTEWEKRLRLLRKNWNQYVLELIPGRQGELEFRNASLGKSPWVAVSTPQGVAAERGAPRNSLLTFSLWSLAMVLAAAGLLLALQAGGSAPVLYFLGLGAFLLVLSVSVKRVLQFLRKP